ncbi:hypothetical protein HU200_050737 [Digitaria exilis]|uniref:Uncharacterized protein n=1 Tax=Digitaria exilis TaxID=1010633 RepID=A0A835ARK6_9POAL|nr:hypothetical protein HU200_050737 [Digitaria exilis]
MRRERWCLQSPARSSWTCSSASSLCHWAPLFGCWARSHL